MKVKIVCVLLAMLAMSVTCQPKNERYIILLKEGASDFELEQFIQKVEVHAFSTRNELFMHSDNSLLPFIHGNFSEATAKMISELDNVDVIEKDQIVSIDDTMSNLEETYSDEAEIDAGFAINTNRYNLDIIDDKECKDGTYKPPNYGTGADIYILDTGINYGHKDFKWLDGSSGRASYGGFDAINPNDRGADCNGHGTHCAGIAGGLSSGIAKDANILSIRVMNCRGSGSYSGIMTGIVEVHKRHKQEKTRPDFVGSIISMSIGGPRYDPLNKMINTAIGHEIIVVTASGNQKIYACKISPGSAGMNINVGSHGYNENCEKPISSFSNYGPCVNIIAPGEYIESADYRSNNGYTKKSGTSMACPHVAGYAALLKADNKALTANQVKGRMLSVARDDIDRDRMPSNAKIISRSKRLYIPKDISA